ncbi:beta-galactosidase BglB [Ideonella livida]|uniref:Glycoside hydrolase family 105 protein n=1 Tax=Ideonella livida TaxID=2707176 RepID=A0A7C9TM44_9BURK|nr:glycoside hydrolase family 88 protein [Ideonella livida]NDY94000.1 glycoside hydrolase family 105 protein [Ideonella livida]
MAASFHIDLTPSDTHALIARLTHNLVNIRDTSGRFLLKLDDGRVIDTKGWNDWEWTHGIGLYGLLRYHQATHDEGSLALIEAWFRDRFAQGTPTKNVNTMAAFLTLAHLHEAQPRSAWVPYLETWAEWVMHDMPRTDEGGLQHIVFNSENPQQLWDDTLMMCVLPLAKIGQVLGRPHYIEEAKRQFLLHVQYLSDRDTGLWFHGWTFDGRHNFARARWARGNCWITMVIPEFLELLEQLGTGRDDALHRHLVTVLDTQARALAPLQDPTTGLWHTLLDDPGSYLEASATAGFAFGLLKGMRRRYLSPALMPVALRALRGVAGHIDAAGELTQVSFGTAMGHDLQFYRDIPLTSMPYGQAMAIMALTESLHLHL